MCLCVPSARKTHIISSCGKDHRPVAQSLGIHIHIEWKKPGSQSRGPPEYTGHYTPFNTPRRGFSELLRIIYTHKRKHTQTERRSPAERPRERGETHLTLLYRWPGDNNPKTPPLPPPQRFLSLSLPVQEASKMRASLGKALYREKKREEPPHGGMRKRELCFRGTPWLAGQNSPRTQRATCQNSRLPARLPDPFHRVELLTCASFAIYRCSLDFCAGLQAASRIVKDYARAIFLSLSLSLLCLRGFEVDEFRRCERPGVVSMRISESSAPTPLAWCCKYIYADSGEREREMGIYSRLARLMWLMARSGGGMFVFSYGWDDYWQKCTSFKILRVMRYHVDLTFYFILIFPVILLSYEI